MPGEFVMGAIKPEHSAMQPDLQDVGLQLHEQGVLGSAPISSQQLDLCQAHVVLHGIYHLPSLPAPAYVSSQPGRLVQQTVARTNPTDELRKQALVQDMYRRKCNAVTHHMHIALPWPVSCAQYCHRS